MFKNKAEVMIDEFHALDHDWSLKNKRAGDGGAVVVVASLVRMAVVGSKQAP